MKKKLLLIIIAGIVVITCFYFGFRNALLNKVLAHKVSVYEKSLGLEIKYKKAAFVGFKTFYISNLETVVNQGDTLIKSDSIVLSPKLFQWLAGNLRLSEIGLYHANITITYQTYKHLRDLFRGNKSDTSDSTQSISYANFVNALQTKFFKLIPSNIIVRNSLFTYVNDTIHSSIYCENFSYFNNDFAGDIFLRDYHEKVRCQVNGILDINNHKVTISLIHGDSSLIKIPYIGPRWNAMLGFDSLYFNLQFSRSDGDHQFMTGDAEVKNLAIHHKRIGPDIVYTKSAAINFTLNIGKRIIELDSSSTVRINHFTFSPFARYERDENNTFSCAFIRKEFDANELFESFPEGLFTNFKGLESKGKLAYSMKASIDFKHPDSVRFESRLENKGFGIKKYGVTDFMILNHEFNQEVYEKERLVKVILVGPDNPDFVSLQDISPYLRYSVLTAEDGDFFYHRGFNPRAFRESIVTNLKEKRFARGGSTITMQLVKNVFLSRNKTISRKVEEALIVWMIENLHLVSKERMFEVYLNIIEWGPGVYGIKPASKFYFNKLPSALSLSESIYLSSIIPRPKGFRYTFVSNGEMSGFYAGYSKLLSSVMLRRNQITPADSAGLKPFVTLTGEAKKYLAVPDTLPREDSLYYVSPIDIFLH